jgi:hypothetical protein
MNCRGDGNGDGKGGTCLKNEGGYQQVVSQTEIEFV